MEIDREKSVMQLQSEGIIWYINILHVSAVKIDVSGNDGDADVTFCMTNSEKISLKMKGHEVDMLRSYYKELAAII